MLKNTFNSAYILLHIKWKVNISIFILFIGKTVKYCLQLKKIVQAKQKICNSYKNVIVILLYPLSFPILLYILTNLSVQQSSTICALKFIF